MRRCYLVCYDIRDDKRLRKVYRTMRDFGDHLQYSIFECQSPPAARFIVLCRDTDSAGSRIVEERILEACSEDLGIKVAGGRACFPDDALTFEELLNKASERMREARGSNKLEAASGIEHDALPS